MRTTRRYKDRLRARILHGAGDFQDVFIIIVRRHRQFAADRVLIVHAEPDRNDIGPACKNVSAISAHSFESTFAADGNVFDRHGHTELLRRIAGKAFEKRILRDTCFAAGADAVAEYRIADLAAAARFKKFFQSSRHSVFAGKFPRAEFGRLLRGGAALVIGKEHIRFVAPDRKFFVVEPFQIVKGRNAEIGDRRTFRAADLPVAVFIRLRGKYPARFPFLSVHYERRRIDIRIAQTFPLFALQNKTFVFLFNLHRSPSEKKRRILLNNTYPSRAASEDRTSPVRPQTS